ncbi:MAG: ABC transporter permease [Propionibacteriaceae bacterium]|nr:ABC transporter permease [Propionibacteriaceae bacterium]
MSASHNSAIRRVTRRSLKQNPSHTVFTVLAITLSAAMISAVCGFAASGRQMLFDFLGEDVLEARQYSAMVYTAAAVFGLILVATSVIIASNAFRASAGERTKQFGLLGSIGATKGQITAAVVYEGVFLSAVGIPLGLLLGNAIHLLAADIVETLFVQVNAARMAHGANGDSELHFAYVFSWPATALAVAVSLVTVLVSAWLPARRAASLSPVEAMRQSGGDAPAAKSVKVSPLTRALFGCEGALAVKYAKRGRRSYRATVAALSISVVLFITGSFFASGMERSMTSAMPYAGVTAGVEYISATDHRLPLAAVERVTVRLAEFPDTIVHLEEATEDGTALTVWLAETDDVEGFRSYAMSVLEEIVGAPQSDQYRLNTYDTSKITAGQRAVMLAVRLFTYGFVALLTLIAVTNVISTVVTNMRLRNREFALLRAIGMSRKNFSKMLRHESLLSSARALLYGIPLGSAFAYILYTGFMRSTEFGFVYPWLAVAISLAGVIVIVFAATKIAQSRINRLSVIEALHE